MAHLLPQTETQKYTRDISDTKRESVANLQQHIRDILGESYHTFLQGSYRNTTSTSDINDVDIVAVRKNVYSTEHTSVYIPNPIPYPWETIFNEIETCLKNQWLYSWTVTPKDKCITVETSNFKADIVPAIQVHADVTIDPVAIYSHESKENRLSYPRDHWENGKVKHSNTNGNYKPMVRMFKNWIEEYLWAVDVVSSHKMESLVYSVPDEFFVNDYLEAFINIGDHMINALTRRDVFPFQIMSVCGNEDITKSWPIADRQHFRDKLKEAVQHARMAYQATTVEDAKLHWNKAFAV